MATLTPFNPALVQSSPAKAMDYRNAFVENAQVYPPGLFMKVVAGLAKICTTSGHSGVAEDAIQLYTLAALATATGDDVTEKTFGVVHEDDIWVGHLSSAIAAAMTVSGQKYQLVVSGTNQTLLNTFVDGATHGIATCLGPVWHDRIFSDNSADTYARIYLKILQAAIYAEAA